MNGIQMMTVAVCLGACASASAQARENFMQQQAYAEMQRVSGQVDVLQNNLGDLQRRVDALEGKGGESNGLRQEIETLKAAVADLRRQLSAQRGEIVRDLSGRIAKMQTPPPPPPKPVVEKKVVLGPHVEYTVQPGDSLMLIAQAFNTTVARIKELNRLKGNNLRVGQKLNLPKTK